MIQYDEERVKNSRYYKIGFFVNEELKPNEIKIMLEDKIGKWYYMIPVRMKWSSKFQEFKWESDFAKKNGIKLYDLYAIAKVKRIAPTISIIPITLYYEKIPDNINKYSFIFISSQQVTIQYHIFNEDRKLIIKNILLDQPRNEEIKISWDCKDAPEGKYYLVVKYSFSNVIRVENFSDTYEFYLNKY